MDLEQGLKIELSSIAGLTTKIFPVAAPQGTTAPYLTYKLDGAERLKDLSGHNGSVEGRFQLDVYHAKYSNLKTLMKSIIAKLKSVEQSNIGGAGPYIQEITIENEFETFDSNVSLYRGIIELNIYFGE